MWMPSCAGLGAKLLAGATWGQGGRGSHCSMLYVEGTHSCPYRVPVSCTEERARASSDRQADGATGAQPGAQQAQQQQLQQRPQRHAGPQQPIQRWDGHRSGEAYHTLTCEGSEIK